MRWKIMFNVSAQRCLSLQEKQSKSSGITELVSLARDIDNIIYVCGLAFVAYDNKWPS